MKKIILILLAAICVPVCVHAQTGAIAPPLVRPFWNPNSGALVPLGFVCTTGSGGNTPLATYQNLALSTPNQNPIRLNAFGEPVNGSTIVPIYLTSSTYRFTLYAAGIGNTCNGTTVGAMLWQQDGILNGQLGGAGTGTTDLVTKWLDATTIGSSNIYSTAPNVGINIKPVDDPVRDVLEVFHSINDSTRITIRNDNASTAGQAALVIREGNAGTNNAFSLGVTSPGFTPVSGISPNQALLTSAAGASSGMNFQAHAGPFIFQVGSAVEAARITTSPFLQLTASYTGLTPCDMGTVAFRNDAGALEACQNGGAWLPIGGSGGGVTGTGTASSVPKWTTASNIGNSSITDDASNVAIGDLPSITNNAPIFANASKQLKTDEGNFNWDSANKRLYVGFGPITDGTFTGSGQVVATGSGGLVVATATTNASTGNFNVVSGQYVSINAGRTSVGGTRLPFAIFTGGAESLRVQTSNNVSIGTTADNGFKLDVQGTLNVTGHTTLNTIDYTWPASQSGSTCLINAGAGSLSWGSCAGGGSIGGSGTTNTVPKFTGSAAIGNSTITDNGTTITLGEPVSFSSTTTLNGQAYTWPGSQTSSDCLSTNGSGTLSWVSCGGSISGSGSANVLTKWTGSTSVGTSSMSDSSGAVSGATSFAIGPGTLPSSTVLYGSSDSGSLYVMSLAAANSGGPANVLRKSRGTHASPSDVQNGDSVGAVLFDPYSGGTFFTGASVVVKVAGTFTSGQAPPSSMDLETNAANSSRAISIHMNPDQTVQMPAYGAGTATFDASGNITSSSDENLKDIQGEVIGGLDEILKLKPIEYKWNSTSGLETEHVYVGFSAQNVQSAIPLAVGQNANGTLSLQDRAILAYVVKAIQDLNQRIPKQ